MAKRLLAAGLKAGLLQPLLPRAEGELASGLMSAGLLEHVQEVLGRQDLSFAISLGTLGGHRKPVIQLLEASGQVVAYAKVGWNEPTRELVRYEADILRRLEAERLECLVLPRILYLGRWHELEICMQSAPQMEAKQAASKLSSAYLEALLELAALDCLRTPIAQSSFWDSLNRWTGSLESTGYGTVLHEALERIRDRIGERELPFHFCHGDFVPWNALLANGRPFLYDWEYARGNWLPGYDLFHFHCQTRLLLSKSSPARIFREVLEATRAPSINIYWKRLEIEEHSIPSLLLLYLMERVVYHGRVNYGQYPAFQRSLTMAYLGLAEVGLLP